MSLVPETVAVLVLSSALIAIILEWRYRFRLVGRMGSQAGTGLYVANTALTLLAVESPTALVLFGSGLLLSDIHLAIVLVGLPPTVGFAIAFTRLVTGTLHRPDESVEALSTLVASEARNSPTPAERMSELIRSSIKRGQLTPEGARRVLEAISVKDSDLARHAQEAMHALQ